MNEMNILELIEKLKEIQNTFEQYDKKYYSEYHDEEYKSPDLRIEDLNSSENKWLESISYHNGSGYEEHPEVVLD